ARLREEALARLGDGHLRVIALHHLLVDGIGGRVGGRRHLPILLAVMAIRGLGRGRARHAGLSVLRLGAGGLSNAHRKGPRTVQDFFRRGRGVSAGWWWATEEAGWRG